MKSDSLLTVLLVLFTLNLHAQTTYYTFQSGNLNDVNIWTTDPSGTLLLGSATPGATDVIVILNGRTITISTNTRTFAGVTIQEGGAIDIGTTTGHNFTTVTGRGTLILSSATVPAGNFTDFYSASGGTMEFSGTTTYNLPNLGTIRNLTISGTGIKVIANNWTLHQDLRINSGTLRIGNNNTARTITINGDVYVESSATWGIRNQNNPLHQVNLYGSLFNDGGTVDFINSALNYTGNPSGGSAVLNMLGTSNEQIVADGVIELNRLIINKGSDKTFVVHITSTTSGNFRLYGRNNESNGSVTSPYSDENPEILKALWIRNGTLRLGFNVDIPSLSEGGNDYFIPQNAELWVDGADIDVTTTANGTGNQGLTVYGTFRITDGYVDTQNSAGFVYRNSGVFFIEGGTCRMSQLRRSGTAPAGNFTSYIQSGGVVIVDGVGENSDAAARFSLDKPESVFRMSGGTLRVSRSNGFTDAGQNRGGIHILSDPVNFQVTGGTVEIQPDNANFSLSTTAPFYNLAISNPTSRIINLREPLIVLNDMSIGTGMTFTNNNNNLTVGGDFTNSGTFNPGTSTFTLNGSGNAAISFNPSGTQVIQSVTIAKSVATDTVTISNGAAIPVRITGDFRMEQGLLNYGNYIVNARGDVYVSARIGIDATAGELFMDGASAQTIETPVTGGNPVIGRLRLSNANGTTLNGGSLYVGSELALDDGVFTIGSRALYTYGSITTSGTFGLGEMIQTDANASDGGLGRYVSGNGVFLYPIGVSGKFTPATMTITNFDDDGIIRLNPAEGELQTLVRPDGSALTYYFRARVQDFSTAPDVSYVFNFNAADVPGGDTPDVDYVSGSVIGATRTTYGAAGVNVGVADFTVTAHQASNANYTAATPAKFAGTVRVLYSRGNMNSPVNWNQRSTWSLISHTGAQLPGAEPLPGPGDICIIGFGGTGNMNSNGGNTHWITLNVNNVEIAELQFNWGGPGIWRPRLRVEANRTGINFGNVSGQGEMYIMNTSTNTPSFTGDFGDFATQDVNNVFNYYLSNNATITIPTDITVYPTLRFEGNSNGNNVNTRIFTSTVDLIVLGGLNIDWGATFLLNPAVGGGNVEVFGANSRLGDGGSAGRLLFPTTGVNRTITYHGNVNLNVSGNKTNRIAVDNSTPNGLVHRLRIGGNLNQNSTQSSINLFTNNSGGNNVELEFINANSGNSYTRSAGAVLNAYRIIVNKGTDTSSDFTMNDTYTLGGPTNGATKALEIQNGLFIHNASSTINLSSGGADFTIPASGGLQVAAGTMTINGGSGHGILLDGLLRISGGNVTMGTADGDDNYIEYTASGSAIIDISSGTLTVGSQIRRGFLSTTGILNYTQSGGTVTVGRYTVPSNERGTFEIINVGSSFTHSAGTLTIVREQPNANVAGFIFQPTTANATGDITIGSANTPASQTIDIDASQPVGSLIISNAPTALTARLLVNNLTINTNLQIGAGSTFNTNSLNINIAGNFVNNGTFTGVNSETRFFGGAVQAVTFNSATTFHDLEIDKSANAVTFGGSQNPVVSNEMRLVAGTIDDGGRTIVLQGNMHANATHQSTGAGRILFQGSQTQEITGNGSGSLGSIEINNASGIILLANLSLTGTSTLTNGIFNIEGNQLTFGLNASIAGTPNSSRMFRNDGSLNAFGFRKVVGTGASNFTFPIGTNTHYTPARYNFSANATQGTITVKPVTIFVNSATDGKDDVLDYHWNVASSGFTSFTVTHEYTYDDSFLQFADIAAEADYVGGRYNSSVWTADGTVNTTTNLIQFANLTVLTGEYTAGDANEFGVIPTYYSRSGKANILTTGALWTEADTWSTREWTDPLHNDPSSFPATPPDGNAVEIRTGHIVLINSVSQRSSSINLNGTLDLGTTFSHIFGNVSGSGNLIIGSTTVVFPSGNFDAFTGTGGGTVTYNAAADITIPPQSQYWNLVITGANTRSLPATDITVNNNLVIENTARLNGNNRNITLLGNWINNSANGTPFSAGTGTVILAGSAAQNIGGTANTSFYGLTISNNLLDNTLSRDITVTGTFTVSNGRLDLNGRTVTLGTAATLSEAATNVIYGTSGEIITNRFLGSSPGNVAGLGFNISSSAIPMQNTTIIRRHSKITAQGLNSILRYFVVTPTTNSGLNATVVFNYDQTEVDGTHDENTYVLYRKPTAGTWQQRGGSVNTSTNQITLAGIDAFSEWTVDEGSSLPVELVGLAIQEIRNRPIIKWETATEFENYGFFIERTFLDDSTNADQWTELGFVEGAGTIYERQQYQFQDENVSIAGRYHYRLRQTDFDGKTKLFGPIEFMNRPPDYFMLEQNYPNPFNPETKIPYQVAVDSRVSITVFNIVGQRVQTLIDQPHKAGTYTLTFDATRLASGVYLVVMRANGFQFTRKIMLIK